MNNDITIVKPAGSSGETVWFMGGVAVLLLLSSIILNNQRVEDSAPRLYNWQISAFHDLNSTDQAIYTALSTASEELWWIHGDYLMFADPDNKRDPWPTVSELDQDFILPPFTKDLAWSRLGRVNWRRIASFSFEGSTVYMGSGGVISGQSAYLVMLSHVHKGASYTNGATIWVHPDPDVPEPVTIKRDSLIVHGWKEVVPYSGADEVERLRG